MRKITVFIMFFTCQLNAQDIHFSQFSFSNLNLNPALIGSGDNDYNMLFQRRSQWQSITTPFRTLLLELELKKIFKSNSIGINFINDFSGDSRFTRNALSLGYSYSMYINDDNKLNIGLLGSVFQNKINYDNLVFIEKEDILSNQLTYLDFSVGVAYFFKYNKARNEVGFSLFHINQPNQSFSGIKSNLPSKLVVHSGSYFDINSKIELELFGLYSQQLTQNEIVIGTSFHYKIADLEKKKRVLRTILSARINDAIILGVGILRDNIDMSITYDINTSSLTTASEYKGGFEIAFSYNWDKKDKKQIKQEFKKCIRYL